MDKILNITIFFFFRRMLIEIIEILTNWRQKWSYIKKTNSSIFGTSHDIWLLRDLMCVIALSLTFQRKIVILLSFLKLWHKNKSKNFCKKIYRKFDFRIESTFKFQRKKYLWKFLIKKQKMKNFECQNCCQDP